MQPLGILRMIAMPSSLGDVPAEAAFCFGTGNTARTRALDTGLIEAGRAADSVLLDRARHLAGRGLLECVRLGDLPGVGMMVIDGTPRINRSRNTPPADQNAGGNGLMTFPMRGAVHGGADRIGHHPR